MAGLLLKYPIVLIHGTGASDRPFFWGRIPKTFKEKGIPFYYGKTDGWGNVKTNAIMLKTNLATVSAEFGIEKFNLIAHSKGGIDARYFISTLGGHELVASLTTISTPHLGTPIADYFLNKHLSGDSVTKKLIQRMTFLFGGQSPNPIELVQNLSTHEMESFNLQNKNVESIFYQSFGSTMNTPQDDLLYALGFKYLTRTIGANDGMVPIQNVIWGDRFKHIQPSKGISHAGITDVTRRNNGGLHVPDIYTDIAKGLADMGL